MKDYYVKLTINSEGIVKETKHYTRDQMISELMRPRRIRNGSFSIELDDMGDVLLLKQAVEVAGGVRQLAYDLNVSRETLYNWKSRELIPASYREQIEAMARRWEEV